MPNNPAQTEVFVAGGGPAGLAAAIAARQGGLEVTVADCDQPPIDKACGEGLMPDALAALRELGLTIGTGRTAPFRGIRFLDQRHQVEAEFSHGVGYGIRRALLHQLMTERAMQLGVSLRWRARITRLSAKAIEVDGQEVAFRWLVCADGQNSRLRRWAGLDQSYCSSRRFGFRNHYCTTPWTDHVEVHWSDCGQMYVTPVAEDEICIAFITRHPHLRFDQALSEFPVLSARLRGIESHRDLKGALTMTRRFASVQSGKVALIGEASGSIDAITGEGMSLAFRQALALAEAMRCGDLRSYEAAHRKIALVPRTMSSLLLFMDRHPALRKRGLRALSAEPASFQQMLAIHTGALSLSQLSIRRSLVLGWKLLSTALAGVSI